MKIFDILLDPKSRKEYSYWVIVENHYHCITNLIKIFNIGFIDDEFASPTVVAARIDLSKDIVYSNWKNIYDEMRYAVRHYEELRFMCSSSLQCYGEDDAAVTTWMYTMKSSRFDRKLKGLMDALIEHYSKNIFMRYRLSRLKNSLDRRVSDYYTNYTFYSQMAGYRRDFEI